MKVMRSSSLKNGVGTGIYASVQEACRHIVKYDPEPILPDKRNMEIYEHYYGVFKELYSRNKELFKKMGDGCYERKN